MITIVALDFIDENGDRFSSTQIIKEGDGKSYGSLAFKNMKIYSSTATWEVDMGTFLQKSFELLMNSIPQTFAKTS